MVLITVDVARRGDVNVFDCAFDKEFNQVSMKTILVVNDHPIVLEGLHKVLAGRGFKVVKAQTAESALSLCASLASISLFLIDLSLKGELNGLQLVEELRRRGQSQPVVIYIMQEDFSRIISLADANVEGIVLNGNDLQELTLAVRTVDNGGIYRSEGFEEKLKEARRISRLLSPKDLEVLRRLTSGQSNREIAAVMGLSEKTVEYHRSNILKKLSARSMFEATRRALNLGIID